MSTFKRMCAVVLSMVMMFSVVSTTAFAAEPDTEIKASEGINAEYLAEMEAMGFTEADVAELRNWNLRVANADSMREIDALMDEYQTLVAGTPLAASAAATSFYTSTGGTLELDYTGSFSIFSNVIFTKVVYLPAQQVVYYQNAMNKEGFLDYLISEFVDEGISVITTAVAKKLRHILVLLLLPFRGLSVELLVSPFGFFKIWTNGICLMPLTTAPQEKLNWSSIICKAPLSRITRRLKILSLGIALM